MDNHLHACFTWVSIVEVKIIQVQEKKPLIIGLGLTGKSLVNFLSKSHDELFVVSESFKPHEIEDIDKLGMKLHLNPTIDEDLIDKVSVIYSSPGVPYDHEII